MAISKKAPPMITRGMIASIVMVSPHLLDHLYRVTLFGQFCQVVVPVLILRDQAA